MDDADKKAAELLPCYCWRSTVSPETREHHGTCPAYFRPAVAAALREAISDEMVKGYRAYRNVCLERDKAEAEIAKLRAYADHLEIEIAKLREAIADARNQIAYLHEKFPATATSEAILARLDAIQRVNKR
jgi:uncharacterized coiled-coil DUF342 family protein